MKIRGQVHSGLRKKGINEQVFTGPSEAGLYPNKIIMSVGEWVCEAERDTHSSMINRIPSLVQISLNPSKYPGAAGT